VNIIKQYLINSKAFIICDNDNISKDILNELFTNNHIYNIRIEKIEKIEVNLNLQNISNDICNDCTDIISNYLSFNFTNIFINTFDD
jgi:hypothetical protein